VHQALARASATDVIEHLPKGLGTMLGKVYGDGVELSTGQWQKVALGRAMMRDVPLLLILDEPTASLDAYTVHAIFERYARALESAGRTVGAVTILITHHFSTAAPRPPGCLPLECSSIRSPRAACFRSSRRTGRSSCSLPTPLANPHRRRHHHVRADPSPRCRPGAPDDLYPDPISLYKKLRGVCLLNH
jgi:ABC transporter